MHACDEELGFVDFGAGVNTLNPHDIETGGRGFGDGEIPLIYLSVPYKKGEERKKCIPRRLIAPQHTTWTTNSVNRVLVPRS